MNSELQIEVEQILKHFRELVGSQAQEIATLKATIIALTSSKDEKEQ